MSALRLLGPVLRVRTHRTGFTKDGEPMARAIWNNTVIASSDDVVTVDGYTYFPTDAINWEHLVDSERTSSCQWKGQANYYSLSVNGATNPDAAWQYRAPKQAAAVVKDRIAFWKGVKTEP